MESDFTLKDTKIILGKKLQKKLGMKKFDIIELTEASKEYEVGFDDGYNKALRDLKEKFMKPINKMFSDIQEEVNNIDLETTFCFLCGHRHKNNTLCQASFGEDHFPE